MYFFYAHKGINILYPENTMSAFKEAERIGCKGIELDIHQTSDGVIVISHDEFVDKMTDQSGEIQYLEYSKINRMAIDRNVQNVSGKEHIPTLEEYCKWVKNKNVFTNIEIKNDKINYDGIEKKLVTLLEKYNLVDKVICSSRSTESLLTIKSLNPNIRTGWIVGVNSDENIYRCKELGFTSFHTNSLISDTQIALCHELGITINSYTDKEEEWITLFERGIDSVTVDFYYNIEEVKRK